MPPTLYSVFLDRAVADAICLLLHPKNSRGGRRAGGRWGARTILAVAKTSGLYGAGQDPRLLR
jgi:hypothetical protein